MGARWKKRGDVALGLVPHLTSGFDIFLSSHKHENISRRVRQVDGQHLLHSRVHVVIRRRLGEILLHVERATGDAEDGYASEELREAIGIEGGGGDNELEVSAPRGHLLEQPEEHVRV